MSSSRKGQSIASKACDYCRERKIKGRRLERYRNATASAVAAIYDGVTPDASNNKSPLHVQNVVQAGVDLRIELLCPAETFQTIVYDFLDCMYPIAPVLHQPSFRKRLAAKEYEIDPIFFRLCISVCAFTVASLPRRISLYGFGFYHKFADMVNRACHMVMASRLATSPDWAERPTSDDMICSLLLGTASHYAQYPRRGWVLLNESIHCCRTLDLYIPKGYEGLSIVDREVNKRAFWMLFIVQIHDRLSHRNPHTTLAQDPVLTDWEFLMPLEVEDEHLQPGSMIAPTIPQNAPTPVISGFVILIKVFSCLLDLVAAPRKVAYSRLATQSTFPNLDTVSSPQSGSAASQNLGETMLSEDTLLRTMQSLENVLSDIPEDLKLFSPMNTSSTRAQQFEIMKANIHITKLYLQSWILDRCPIPPSGRPGSRSGLSPPENEQWNISREEIARQLLQVINICSQSTLESHGTSMVVKIREIAATLLDREPPSQAVLDITQPSQHYIARFLDILAALDIPAHQAITETRYS
ncbi:hypothetical protein BP5796_00881 [Coleophoma crateriformis]|uniref:Xylanolytic transcriptional activator regulatory domain-containing protein n=1 Tax=Coleophoma crateriformis TaxID=565419 RepID=A0A3D8TBE7_9HELO|nr:hypothetical protein BP5796_00881 [Coleophoma crateriformis]